MRKVMTGPIVVIASSLLLTGARSIPENSCVHPSRDQILLKRRAIEIGTGAKIIPKQAFTIPGGMDENHEPKSVMLRTWIPFNGANCLFSPKAPVKNDIVLPKGKPLEIALASTDHPSKPAFGIVDPNQIVRVHLQFVDPQYRQIEINCEMFTTLNPTLKDLDRSLSKNFEFVPGVLTEDNVSTLLADGFRDLNPAERSACRESSNTAQAKALPSTTGELGETSSAGAGAAQ